MQTPKTKRLRLLIFSVLLVLTVSMLAGCAIQTRKLSIGTASRISIENNRTYKRTVVTDAETIRKITDNMNRITFRKGESSVKNSDRKYTLTWYDENDYCFKSITVRNDSEINDNLYFWKATGSDKIDTGLYDQLLKNAK